MDGKLKLILGLMWTLIQHYSISLTSQLTQRRDDVAAGGGAADGDDSEQPQRMSASKLSPKKQLLTWINEQVPDHHVTNFTSDWKDGKTLAALVSSLAPGDD